MNKVLEYIIRAKDATSRGISSASGRLRNFVKVVGTNLMNIQAGFQMVGQVIGTVGNFIKRTIQEAFKFEKAVTNFKTLLGSIDSAKAHIEELKRFASETPLTFDDLSTASRLLLAFGSNVNDIMPSLKMLGDIALGDSQRFQGLALVFAQVKSQGKLMGQDLLQMVNQGFNPLTVISKETGVAMGELKDMMAEGLISFEMVEAAMKRVTSEGGIFHNALKDASQTGEGLTSTLQDKLNESLRQIGDTFAETAKGGMSDFIRKLDELNKNGSIQKWAEGASNAIQGIGYALYGVWKGTKWYLDKANPTQLPPEVIEENFKRETAGLRYDPRLTDPEEILRAQGWKKFSEEGIIIGNETIHSYDWYKKNNEWKRVPILKNQARIKALQEAESKKVEADKKAAEEEAVKERTLQEMIAEAKAKEEEKLAAKKAEAEKKAAEVAEKERKKAEEAALKQAEKEAEAKRRLLEKLAYEKEMAEERLHQKNLTRLQEELSVSQGEASDAHGRLMDARSRLAQAWKWYRDPASMQAHIDDVIAQREAEGRFEKEFSQFKDRRRDWRSIEVGKLSAHEEAIRQVALAKEAEAQAKKDLAAIAKNTEDLAAKLDELMSLKEGAA